MENSTNITDSRMDQTRRKAYLRNKGIDLDGPVQLDLVFGELVHDNERTLPNDFARGAIFTARNKTADRRFMLREKVFHLHDGVDVLYTGEELRAEDDELVWLQIVHYCKTSPLGLPTHFHIKDLVSDIGWYRNSHYYKKVRQCLSRLSATEILISNDSAYGKSGTLRLIKEYTSKNDARGEPSEYFVMMDPKIIVLFAGSQFSNHRWELYRDLSPVARRLADYSQSHRQPWDLKLDKFKQLCGCTVKTDFGWRRTVRNACAELVDKGVVQAFVDKGKDAVRFNKG